MRKLLMLAVMALAALAVSAPSALATNPDFPYGDYDAGNWRAVVAVDNLNGGFCQQAAEGCEVHGYESSWGWKSSTSSEVGWCSGAFDSAIGADGGVSTVGDINTGLQGICGSLVERNNPWDGQICANVDTGDLWLRQEMDFQLGGWSTITGESFARLGGDPVGDGVTLQTISFGTGSNFTRVGSSSWGHRADFDVTEEYPPTLFPTGSETEPTEPAPCGWPELQA